FIISKEISFDDYSKIKAGYNLLDELKPLRISERNDRLNSKAQQELGNLAFMIAMGRAQVKVALTYKGIFHDKFGIISSSGEKVFFNGSANETQSGISSNYESISVDVSWDESKNVQSRIHSNVERFERLWRDEEPGVKVIEISNLAYEEIAKYQTQSKIDNITISEDYAEEYIENTNAIYFKRINNKVIRIDKTDIKITSTDRKLK